MKNSWIVRQIRRILSLWSWSWGKWIVIVVIATTVSGGLYSCSTKPTDYEGSVVRFTLQEGWMMTVTSRSVLAEMASSSPFIIQKGEELLGSHQSTPPVGWQYTAYYFLTNELYGSWRVEKSGDTVYVLVQDNASSIIVVQTEEKKNALKVLCAVIFTLIVFMGLALVLAYDN